MIELFDRKIGPNRPCLVIAEAGVNHNGSVDLARELIAAAARSGADAVKFQTFKADRLVSPGAPKAGYQLETTEAGESQRAMLKRLELSADAHRELMACCRQQGVGFLSTPFDEESVDLLFELGVEAFKIGSGELTDLPFLSCVAGKGRPVILSTGMSSMDEVETAMEAVRTAGNCDLVLLQCVSNYPADPADANLRAMTTMASAFDVPVGYSDHTLGTEVALAAVALGACVVEKHLTLDRSLPGPDHRSSVEPDELEALVAGIRKVESALGDGRKRPSASEAATAAAARRSLTAAVDIPAGAVLTREMIAIRRPGTGLPPAMRDDLIGRKAARAIPAGALIQLDMLA